MFITQARRVTLEIRARLEGVFSGVENFVDETVFVVKLSIIVGRGSYFANP